jgi:hypothetical protein
MNNLVRKPWLLSSLAIAVALSGVVAVNPALAHDDEHEHEHKKSTSIIQTVGNHEDEHGHKKVGTIKPVAANHDEEEGEHHAYSAQASGESDEATMAVPATEEAPVKACGMNKKCGSSSMQEGKKQGWFKRMFKKD